MHQYAQPKPPMWHVDWEWKTLEDAITSIGMVVEGAYTVKSANALRLQYQMEMPITAELYKVLYEGKDAKSAVMALMSRQRKHELDEYATGIDNWS